MKIKVEEQSDSIDIRFDESKIIESEQVKQGIIFDFNAQSQIVGIEILRVQDRIPLANLKQLYFEIAQLNSLRPIQFSKAENLTFKRAHGLEMDNK